ncbi:MAG: AAA family ATPase [Bacteroidota bacterium]
MKILSVDMLNLNSLKGRQVIRFDESPLVDAGLFAIIGKTGAGKTTILDAICLALYGRTPRYKNGDEVMSWGTGECHAEVEFSCRVGRFRARWELRRAYGKPDGKLGSNQREISIVAEDGKGEIITSRIKEVNAKVEELTRLDFDRFTRSVLLPQGEFARFLKANEKERSALLESITGTQLYSELSTAAYDRHQLAEQQRQKLREQRENLQLLRPEERAAAEEEMAKNAHETHQLDSELERLRKQLDQLNAWRKLKADRAVAETRVGRIQEQQKVLAPQKKKYEASIRLRSKAAALMEFAQLEQQLLDINSKKEEREKVTSVIATSIPEMSATTDRCYKVLSDFNSEKPRREQTIKQARDLQLKIADRQQESKKGAQLAKRLKSSIDGHRNKLEKIARDEALFKAAFEKIIARLDRYKPESDAKWADDERLLLAQLQESVRVREKALERLNSKLEYADLLKSKRQIDERQAKLQAQRTKLEKAASEVNESLVKADKAYALATEALELIRQQEVVTDLRKSLKKNEPCQVCGSLDHPALENWKAPSQALRKEAENRLSQVEDELTGLRKLESDHAQQLAALSAQLAEQAGAGGWQQSFALKFQKLSERFQKERISGVEQIHADIQTMLEEIDLLSAVVENLSKLVSKAGAENTDKGDDLKRELDGLKKELQAYEEKLKISTSEIENWAEEIKKLLGGLGVDEARAKLEAKAEELRNAWQQAAAAEKESKTRLGAIQDELKRLEGELSRTSKKKVVAEQALTEELGLLGVASIAIARETLLSVEEEQRLANALGKLEKEMAAAQEAISTIDKQLDNYDESLLKVEKEKDWNKSLKEKELLRSEILKRQGALQEKLAQDEQKKRQLGELVKKAEQADLEVARWSALKELIGMKDGSKFREFAQGLTLAKLVQLANRHLQVLNGRYLLRRPEGSNLELEVIDTYQADNCRPTYTLSGGESFVLSLALALGLSDLAGRNTRIESLFIDEGFGTLDSASLDLVLDVLDRLRGQGKTIGLISHVRALQERIHHQVKITSDSEGFGRLQIV